MRLGLGGLCFVHSPATLPVGIFHQGQVGNQYPVAVTLFCCSVVHVAVLLFCCPCCCAVVLLPSVLLFGCPCRCCSVVLVAVLLFGCPCCCAVVRLSLLLLFVAGLFLGCRCLLLFLLSLPLRLFLARLSASWCCCCAPGGSPIAIRLSWWPMALTVC